MDVVDPIASSISFRSAAVIRGWVAGVSKMSRNHNNDHNRPIPPKKSVIEKKINDSYFSYVLFMCLAMPQINRIFSFHIDICECKCICYECDVFLNRTQSPRQVVYFKKSRFCDNFNFFFWFYLA